MQCVVFFPLLRTWDYTETDRSFDLCEDSKAPEAFFPGSRRAMIGVYVEVPCSEWEGSEGETLWNGACMAPEGAPSWPEHSCGNKGAKHSLVCVVM